MNHARTMRERIATWSVLCRMEVSFFAASSAAVGSLLVSRELTFAVLPTFLAVFFLACGSSALNQFQERDIDSRMPRTRNRPIPSRTLSAKHALFLAAALIFCGSLLLAWGGTLPAVLGVVALLWYNGIYTFLKKRTAYAAVPGALVGALPPAIGWTAAGGSLGDPRLLMLGLLFFLWQVPHFLLLVLQYGKEYEGVGLPSLTAVFTAAQIARITFVWIFATTITSLMLPLYNVMQVPLLYLSLAVVVVWFIVSGGLSLLKEGSPGIPRTAFRMVNGYIFLVMVVLAADAVVLGLS